MNTVQQLNATIEELVKNIALYEERMTDQTLHSVAQDKAAILKDKAEKRLKKARLELASIPTINPPAYNGINSIGMKGIGDTSRFV